MLDIGQRIWIAQPGRPAARAEVIRGPLHQYDGAMVYEVLLGDGCYCRVEQQYLEARVARKEAVPPGALMGHHTGTLYHYYDQVPHVESIIARTKEHGGLVLKEGAALTETWEPDPADPHWIVHVIWSAGPRYWSARIIARYGRADMVKLRDWLGHMVQNDK